MPLGLGISLSTSTLLLVVFDLLWTPRYAFKDGDTVDLSLSIVFPPSLLSLYAVSWITDQLPL